MVTLVVGCGGNLFRLIALAGLASLSWAGHLFHITSPGVFLLDSGVDSHTLPAHSVKEYQPAVVKLSAGIMALPSGLVCSRMLGLQALQCPVPVVRSALSLPSPWLAQPLLHY